MEKLINDVAVELLGYNTSDKNILKVAEECAELGEVMIKLVTKTPLLKPKMEKIAEEMGDTIFRIKVAAKLLGIEKEVDARQIEKAEQIKAWIAQKKYKGGV